MAHFFTDHQLATAAVYNIFQLSIDTNKNRNEVVGYINNVKSHKTPNSTKG